MPAKPLRAANVFSCEVQICIPGGNMSLRDFNNTPFPDDPTALHHGPVGNETGLENFHTVQPEDIEPNNTPKIVGAIAVALMVGVAGVALYTSQGSSTHAKQMVAAVPAPTAPVNPPPAAAPLPDANMPASAPLAAPEPAPVKSAATEPAAPKSAPVKSASVAKSQSASESSSASDAMSARMAAANDANQVSPQPQQQAAITPTAPAPEQQAAIPLPAGPSPSPSDLATNNTQSGVAVPQGAASASDIPNPAPAQGANPVPEPTPEPTQPSALPSGQIAQ
jgi:hypothetical protein